MELGDFCLAVNDKSVGIGVCQTMGLGTQPFSQLALNLRLLVIIQHYLLILNHGKLFHRPKTSCILFCGLEALEM